MNAPQSPGMDSNPTPTLVLAPGLARFLVRPQSQPRIAWRGPRFAEVEKVRRTDTILRNGLGRPLFPSFISLHVAPGRGAAALTRSLDRVLPN